MPSVGFEPTISAGERPKTYALDRAATGTGTIVLECAIVYNVALRVFEEKTVRKYMDWGRRENPGEQEKKKIERDTGRIRRRRYCKIVLSF